MSDRTIIKCKKIGKGTEEDPIRPELPTHFSDFHKALINFKKDNDELPNVTYYTTTTVGETDTEFEVEITFPDEEYIKKHCPKLLAEWKKLKEAVCR